MKQRVREEEEQRRKREEAETRKEARLRAKAERQEYLDELERKREAEREEREHQHELEMAKLRLAERDRSRRGDYSDHGGSDSGYSERSRSRSRGPHGPGSRYGGYAPQQPPPSHPPWWFGGFPGFGHAAPPQQPVTVNINNVNGAPSGHAQTGAASTSTGMTHDQAQRGRSRSRSRDPQEEAHEVLRKVRSGSKDVHAKVYPDGRVRNDSAYGGSDYGSDDGRSRSRSKARATSRAVTPHDAQEEAEEDLGYHSEHERSQSRGRDPRSRSTGPPPGSSLAPGRSAPSRSPVPQGTSGPIAFRNNQTALVPHNKERALARYNSPNSQTVGQGRNAQTAMVVHQRRR